MINVMKKCLTKINICFLVIQCLHIGYLTQKKMLDCYRGKDCMEKICKDLKVHATKIINYEKNK